MVRSAFLRLNGDDYVRYKNLALEQGVDQMRSVPGQDITMTIEPVRNRCILSWH
ncbi:MAG: hypothetical protein SPG03_01920 [Veillonella caviae]|uniref:hypothetical protein n=1 Tax=Veillonella caviae TaxID=248316 RepID=UPI002A91855E|nr:hypothetical protein [Veillonella caviae]MDY5481135.1 hypothetical protein [Veillonella caviae]